MNKKFSTLMAGLLLAGGMCSTLSAETLANAVNKYAEGQYFRVYVNNGDALDEKTLESYGWLDSEEKNGFVTTAESDKSDLWTVVAVKGVNGSTAGYQLVNVKTGKALSQEIEGQLYNTFATNANTRLTWANASNKGYSVEPNFDVKGWYYNIQKVNPSALSKKELDAQNGDSFSIQIGYQETKDGKQVWNEYTTFEGGNVFAGKLYVGEKTTEGTATQYALYTDAARTKRIVLTTDKWEVTSSQLGSGYKFDVLTAKEYAAAKNILADEFIISAPATVQGDPIEVVAVDGKSNKYELVVSVVKNAAGQNVNRLTVANAETDNTADYNNQNGGNTYVKFGQSNTIDYSIFYGKLWNITKDGQVASPVCDGEESFVPAAQVALNYPEGQWLYYDEDGLGYKPGYFQNRESGKTIALAGLRYVEGKENTYTDGTSTYTITSAGDPSDKATIGYLNGYTEDLLNQKAFFIGTPITATGDTVYLKKATNGKLEFTTEKSEAVEFRLAMADFDTDDNLSFKTAQTRTTYTIWDNKTAGTTKVATDVVSYHQYTVADAVSGEVLNYDKTNKRFELADASKGFNPIVIKNKGTDVFNLLYEVATEYNNEVKTYVTSSNSFCNAKKLYGAHNANELVQSQGAYAYVQNDLFVVVDADAQQYRGDFSNTGILDTVKIFRNDDPSYVLYEKGTLLADAKGEAIEGFLGMENVLDPQYATKQPAMLADTAKHANTYRPQYMFAVDAEYVADGWTCPLNPEHNTAAWREENGGHCADAIQDRPYMLGRYLVTLADSAQAAEKAGVKEAANKFKHEGFYRLGFVQAKHMGDSLIIASGTAAQDTIDLSKGYDLPCTFALKYVDENREAFTIETMLEKGYNDYKEYTPAKNSKGYIKYQNGVPVVTKEAKEAWVFNLETLTGEENAPTANETIAAGNVVVAGTNGAVVVKGAEGKSVIVSTILGKVVANEVLTSDNAQITAPAGVVVVSVDGESFKVVVK